MSTQIEAVFEQFTASLSNVLSQALMSPWKVKTSAPSTITEPTVVRFTVAPPGTGGFFIAVGRQHAARLADLFLGTGTAGPVELTPERQDACEELLRQVVGDLQNALKPHLGEIAFRFVAEPLVDRAAGKTRIYECSNDAGEQLKFELTIMNDLTATIRPAVEEVELPNAPVAQSSAGNANLELLLDVELPATLRFGKRHMAMRDILELNSGAVVELDRQVQEPVELLIDGKVVARGELVIVDGTYGIRVSQVATPNQRVALIP